MKRILFLSILTIIFLVSFIFIFGCNNQTPTKEKSSIPEKTIKGKDELQERCGKSCDEYFRNRHVKEGWYECHYNKKLNKCFFLISHLSRGNELYEIHEHKNYGRCSDDGSCYVLDKRCKIQDEWNKLVEPYMKE